MSQAQSVDVPHSYKRLVKMVAYAFYSSHCPPKDHTDEVEDVKNTKKAQQLSKKLQQVGAVPRMRMAIDPRRAALAGAAPSSPPAPACRPTPRGLAWCC
jgi:hypothetical protein